MAAAFRTELPLLEPRLLARAAVLPHVRSRGLSGLEPRISNDAHNPKVQGERTPLDRVYQSASVSPSGGYASRFIPARSALRAMGRRCCCTRMTPIGLVGPGRGISPRAMERHVGGSAAHHRDASQSPLADRETRPSRGWQSTHPPREASQSEP